MITKSLFSSHFLKKNFLSIILILLIFTKISHSKSIIPDITQNEIKIGSVRYDNESKFILFKFDIQPIYDGSELDFNTLNELHDTDILALRLIGKINNEIVEEDYIDSLKANQKYKIVLKDNIESFDLSSTINYTLFLIVKKSNSDVGKTLKYKVEVEKLIISGELLTFLIIGFLFFLAVLFFLRDDIIFKVTNYNWANSKWAIIIDYVARILIIIILIDEIGFFLKEWGINIFIFQYFEFFLRIPFISYAVFIANFIIIIPATYKIILNYLENLYPNKSDLIAVFSNVENFNTYKKKYAFLISLLILIISYLVWTGQCLIWNEVKINEGTPYSIVHWIAGVLIFLPVILMIISEVRISKLSNGFKLVDSKINIKRSFIVLSIVFLSFSQTMITKILVLLPLINKVKNFGYSIINKIPPKDKISEYNLIPKENSRNWNIFNFTLLTTSTFILLLFWQIVITPFPPLESFYPKAFTISLLYMIYMLLYFFLVNTEKFYRIKSVFWILITLFILYGLPIFYPSLFISANDYNGIGFYIIKAFYEMDLLVVAILLFFIFHIIMVYLFYGIYNFYKIKENLFSSEFNNNKLFRKYFFYVNYKDTITLTSFIYMFLFSILFFSKIGLLMILTPIHYTLVCIISLLPIIPIFFDLNSQKPKLIYDEILKFSGSEVVEKLIKRNSFLKIYKSWNNGKRSLTGWLIFFMYITFVYLLFFITLTTLLDSSLKSEFTMLWFNKDTGNVIDIKETNENLICIEKKGLRVLSKDDGKEKFTFSSFQMPLISKINDSLIWFTDSKRINLLNIGSKLTLFGKTLIGENEGNENNSKNNFSLINNKALINEHNKLSIYNSIKGNKVFETNDLNSPFPIIRNGYPLWRNSKNKFCYYDSELKFIPNLIFTKNINLVISLHKNFIIIDNDSTYFFDYSGRRIWTNINYTSLKNINAFDCFVKDSILIFAVNWDSLIAMNKFNGKSLWQLYDHNYVFLPNQIFRLGRSNDLLIKNDRLILVTDSEEKFYEFIDINSGNIIHKIPRKEFIHFFIPSLTAILKDNTFYWISTFSFRGFSISPKKYIVEDPYIINIKRKYPDFFKYDIFELVPGALLVSSDRIYFSNGKGVFALGRK